MNEIPDIESKLAYILGSFAEITFFATANFLVDFCLPILILKLLSNMLFQSQYRNEMLIGKS